MAKYSQNGVFSFKNGLLFYSQIADDTNKYLPSQLRHYGNI